MGAEMKWIPWVWRWFPLRRHWRQCCDIDSRRLHVFASGI